MSIPDVHQWENLPFPRSLPQFQKLFPNDGLYSGKWHHATVSEAAADQWA